MFSKLPQAPSTKAGAAYNSGRLQCLVSDSLPHQKGSRAARLGPKAKAGAGALAHEEKDSIMRKFLSSAAVSALLFTVLTVAAPAATAAPIECPGSQTATKVDDGWACVNKPGNESGPENPKNPNAGKDKF